MCFGVATSLSRVRFVSLCALSVDEVKDGNFFVLKMETFFFVKMETLKCSVSV